jgi:hypothetical protein
LLHILEHDVPDFLQGLISIELPVVPVEGLDVLNHVHWLLLGQVQFNLLGFVFFLVRVPRLLAPLGKGFNGGVVLPKLLIKLH